MNQSNIRNFCIIAHIDHGKSTLADRLLEITGTVEKREMKAQLLDKMDLERERGITIKLAPVRMNYKGYQLNLIDTPGHVDFSYEVSRSLQACEGAILVVDASQGIQAQTLANVYLAMEANLTIIPVLNKIDLPAADVPRVTAEVVSLLGCKPDDILAISAKTGAGVERLLDEVIEKVSCPKGSDESAARALIFDSFYDEYRGVIVYVRVIDGAVPKNAEIKMIATRAEGDALEVGYLSPDMKPTQSLNAGEIGYIVTNFHDTSEARVGDTVSLTKQPADALPGYKEVKPFVYAGFFPSSNEFYPQLKDAIEKLKLSDSALIYVPENSPVLGHGFRIGFLGLLHMDIVRERIEREFDIDLIVTNPSTDYKIIMTNGDELDLTNASQLPETQEIREIKEPWINGEIVVPKEYVGAVIQLVSNARGFQKNISYVDDQLALVTFEAPLANLLTDFYDKLKSQTSGYGSFNYELSDYRAEDLVRVDFYVAGDIVEALSVMCHRTEAHNLGRTTVEKLKDIIPRQNFKVSLQAAIGGKFIAREDLSAFRKDVTVGLYGGDVSRKKKVLAKQKRGKERLKRFGKVDLPAEAFTVLLKRD
ncbi:MAG TPA: translation elongation factor 4 [Candidatus Saccharibacteria bacterium]|jgi:GTP-binding protein LepA|nr:translation elongation factor 4 [Candidatus Saccharibacteria bacterium]